ncbi:MAG: cyclase family protein [Oscillospiraceae bacterium]|jgi:arylformamidase|nr:cyclase family protein [Oscillospiraceae bacterium]
MRIIDISQAVLGCGVYPGDSAPAFARVKTLAADGYNLTDISMCVHNGTHVDAPCHFVAGGRGMDEVPLDVFYGPCTVADCSGVISAAAIAPVLATCHERLLLKGGCEISREAAEAIAASRVRLVGVEGQSVGNADAPMAVHLVLLNAGIIPLEGLNLSGAEAGAYTLCAFPLNLRGADGSPVRAVLISRP